VSDVYAVKTERLRLRDLDPERDVDLIFSMQSLPEVARYTPFEPRTRDQVAFSLSRLPDVWRMVVEVTATGEGIGDALVFPAKEDGSREIGYEFHPSHWGQGYATEMTRGLVAHLFAMGVPRLGAIIDPENAASRIVLERCGFVEVGRSEDEAGPIVEFSLDAPGADS
jgi:RimJ/RimL family protein N-acetyltransferase